MRIIPDKELATLSLSSRKKGRRWSETKIIFFSFLAILLPAALLLTLPVFSVSGLSFIDALFTATSAISVTGLGVVDTGTHFTTSGQILLMLLMQIGGLGQMTLSTILIIMFGLRLSLKQQALAKEQLGQEKFVNLRQLIVHIMTFVLITESIGVLILTLYWQPTMGWSKGLFYAVFHSISAFNNAGFSLFPDSLSSFASDPIINFTIAGLLIAGGIGFPVVSDIKRNWRRGFRFFSLHTKVMLTMTPALLIFGTVMLWLLEHNNPDTLGKLSFGGQWLAAFFQSASARTAGFNTINIGALTHPAMLIMIILMLIGAGSTSTAGGIKVSTFTVAMVATKAFLKQQPQVILFKRTIPNAIVTKCLAITVVSILVLVIALFVLMVTENAPMDRVVFETISAFGTVGLTAGLTAHLTVLGKVIMVMVMIIGRLGPLTLAYMLSKPKRTLIRYPEDNIFAG
ncbi:TrkH family potassium uptake protein [Vibrio sp. SS-MA-C1-2]|uniref:TrkH family potassium uptake protein n=1 Tax=Vibrio sp. SS-MA-C1-2 TaxID=2908646 RepID=UPI001F42B2E2|nr:TrkH family potassium uptake protein [Vibrio sp. SS-MA-C1-2]UJF18561.1 TrkH family potassium uptake protein [Vibrio sp. SS-MA-C1-2]